MEKFISTFIFCSLLISGCVTQKKYDELLADDVKKEGDIQDLDNKLKDANSRVDELNESLTKIKDENELNKNNLAKATEELKGLKTEQEKLTTLYDNLLKNSGKRNRELALQQEQLLDMEISLTEATAKNDALSIDLLEREKKVEELEKVLADKEKVVLELKEKVNNALLSFNDNGLTVEVKNGKVYISLTEQLLFQSGSIEIDSKGISALKQLAGAIKDSKDINIMVEGHTDNVPISNTSRYMNDNWDLSVMRATTIIRVLINSGVAPDQIMAAGKGEFDPIIGNSSDVNKQRNRRTEIILTPKLDELFEILESN